MTTNCGQPIQRLHLHAQSRAGETTLERLSEGVLNVARSAAGAFCQPPKGRDWIIFQFYHWVLDDERDAFERQLKFLRRYGDFVSLDDAVAALQSPTGISGRHFCVTFDDGFKHCFTNAAPILKELEVPAAFFLPTRYIGLTLADDWEQIAPFYEKSWTGQKYFFEFLSWDECRQLSAAGFTLGSHTHSHARLATLQPAEAETELKISKQIVEERLGVPCRHFCAPWGKSGRDFNPLVHPEMAKALGYASFLTTDYGVNRRGDSAHAIRRIGSIPVQSPLRLRYSLFPSWLHSLRGAASRNSK